MELSNKEKKRLKEKYPHWTIITGASSGIGLALAEALASCGMDLVVNARNEANLERLATRWENEYNIQVIVVASDLSKEEGVALLLEKTASLKVSLLIAAAGFGTSGAFVESRLETEVNMLRLNCEAVVKLSHHFAQQFKAQGAGGLVLFGSLVGFQGTAYAAAYAATKAFVQTFAEGLAVELAPYGVDVLGVAPGPVKTGFGERAAMDMGGATPVEKVVRPTLAALGRQDTVVPGSFAKFLYSSLSLLPRWAKVQVMSKIMKGMAAEK